LAAPDPRPFVPVLAGPTAVGKTAVAVALGRLLPITVISADARQVYRGLDIGTAKPDAALRARLPHRGIDVVDPGERYSAGRFARDAARWLAEIAAEGRQPLVVGGTGLYIRALAGGLFREPALDPARRDRLRQWAQAMPPATLARWASRLDPAYRGGGRQRSARSVEMALLTGRPLSWWQREAREAGVMRPWYILLTLPRDALHRRIAARVDAMLAAGLVEEVRAVLARGVPADAPGLDAVGYREVVAMLAGRLRADELRDAIVLATRQYAKRQETWFRHQLRGEGGSGAGEASAWVLDASAAPERIAALVHDRWTAIPRSAIRNLRP
jgi:tRNA dimethylallyltransferase